ncbi:MAG: hypothetical protein C5B52_04980 [Bacteroidetes bacterium]|nr:MAG: hypothetical protein C5B52_04980 [Bacteroidota bacterium]
MTLSCFSQHYRNFKVSVYCRAYEVRQMGDTNNYLKPRWDEISRQLKVDKIYLETHRDLIVVNQDTLNIAKKFFKDRGIEIAGGITLTISEPNRFQTFCYSNPDDRKRVKELSEYTAKNFNEFILDDFFFTNCKDDSAIKEKGDKSWTDYRLALMTEAARTLIVGPAKAVNPKVKVVVKYPNWYDHFPGMGFNLETEPKIFDGIYTGTETRDAVLSAQHLQPYLGYNIIRYFENIAPGRNGGGWVDPFGSNYSDRYAEQLWITLFAKAREQTLFDFRSLTIPIQGKDRSPWQGQNTSFDYDAMMKPQNYNGGSPVRPTSVARVAGFTFEKVDSFLNSLGNPIGIKSYKPYQSSGEDFLQNYLGMIGLPMNMVPEFPAADSLILLTEEAKYDTKIVEKIKKQLTEGKKVVITSGLLRAIQDKVADISVIKYTDRKAIVQDFTAGTFQLIHIDKAILIPQIEYITNDSWELVSAIQGDNGWPILHDAGYSKGHLYVLTIPDNFSDLYNLPVEVLNKIRQVLSSGLNIQIEGPGKISLFLYDNNTFIVESFLDTETIVKIVTPVSSHSITDINSSEQFNGELRKPGFSYIERNSGSRNVFSVTVKPHSFRVFKIN